MRSELRIHFRKLFTYSWYLETYFVYIYIHIVLNSVQFRPIHLRQLEVTLRVNLVRPCSCPRKPHSGYAVFCLFLSSFPWDHVQAQAIEWRWVASICMRVMQFGSIGKHVCETPRIVKKLIPLSNGDEPKATSLLLLKEILWACTEVFCSQPSAHWSWPCISGAAHSTGLKRYIHPSRIQFRVTVLLAN